MRWQVDMTQPAYITSVEASQDLVYTIHCHPRDDRLACLASAIEDFTTNQYPELNPELRLMLHTLDKSASMHSVDNLLACANQFDCVSLLAATTPHNRARFLVVPTEGFSLLPN